MAENNVQNIYYEYELTNSKRYFLYQNFFESKRSSIAKEYLLLQVAGSAALISPASEKKAWLILAWVSTVAGNLSLMGSAANIVVCEQARRAPDGYDLSFWSHLKFGVPSTLIVTAIGTRWLQFIFLEPSQIWSSLHTHSHSNWLGIYKMMTQMFLC
ncbi:unnamed protein product [Ilex paraguariensis]|uniref:Citrate transporter-like domain-containing protein n=1 Tax=Ilex paraguariensis TaxID=185542 RepID=A0ABC8UVF0_9AQUA